MATASLQVGVDCWGNPWLWFTKIRPFSVTRKPIARGEDAVPLKLGFTVVDFDAHSENLDLATGFGKV
jgi:hypothetical protein